LGGLLLTGVVLFFIFRFLKVPGGSAVVRVSGKEYGTYSLSQDQIIEIRGKDSGTNLLVIQNGKASIEEASCPDLLCVHQGSVYRQGESIICLPNEVVVEITGTKEELPYDVMAG